MSLVLSWCIHTVVLIQLQPGTPTQFYLEIRFPHDWQLVNSSPRVRLAYVDIAFSRWDVAADVCDKSTNFRGLSPMLIGSDWGRYICVNHLSVIISTVYRLLFVFEFGWHFCTCDKGHCHENVKWPWLPPHLTLVQWGGWLLPVCDILTMKSTQRRIIPDKCCRFDKHQIPECIQDFLIWSSVLYTKIIRRQWKCSWILINFCKILQCY